MPSVSAAASTSSGLMRTTFSLRTKLPGRWTYSRGRRKRTAVSSAFGKFQYRWYRAEFVPTDLWRNLSPAEWLRCKMGGNLFMQTATWLVSRELSEAAGPWDIGMLSDDDGEYFCRVLLNSDGVRFVPESRIYYRAFGYDSLAYCVGASKRNWTRCGVLFNCTSRTCDRWRIARRPEPPALPICRKPAALLSRSSRDCGAGRANR